MLVWGYDFKPACTTLRYTRGLPIPILKNIQTNYTHYARAHTQKHINTNANTRARIRMLIHIKHMCTYTHLLIGLVTWTYACRPKLA